MKTVSELDISTGIPCAVQERVRSSPTGRVIDYSDIPDLTDMHSNQNHTEPPVFAGVPTTSRTPPQEVADHLA
ncbi:hypothetical protein FACS1894200_00560 [Spirochaetia bacterium]|nr:hypothetical protein FACS1894200_00560 [Spirochaetia bacterium]